MNPVLLLTLVLSSILGALSFACAFFNDLFLAQLTLGGAFILALLAALIDALQDAEQLRPNRPLTTKERSLLQARRAARARARRER